MNALISNRGRTMAYKKIVFWWIAIICVIINCIGLVASVTASWVLEPNNPFTEVTDDGWADLINLTWTDNSTADGLVNIVKWVINWALGILAFIALVVLLYGWFLMVTAAWESDRYDKWFTILKQAAVGLVIIGVARFIVSIIFRLINLTAEQSGAAQWAWTDS